jgi:hypothetical protein
MRFGALWIKRLLIVASTNFIPWGEALCMSMAAGRPEASAMAMIWVPLLRFVLPILSIEKANWGLFQMA